MFFMHAADRGWAMGCKAGKQLSLPGPILASQLCEIRSPSPTGPWPAYMWRVTWGTGSPSALLRAKGSALTLLALLVAPTG